MILLRIIRFFAYCALIRNTIAKEEAHFLKGKTKLLLTLIRSGAQTPRATIKTDDNSFWGDEYGVREPTPTGIRQLYTLGKYLRSEYQEFMESIKGPDEIKATAIGVNRGYFSAQALLAGAFPGDHNIDNEDNDPRILPEFVLSEQITYQTRKVSIPGNFMSIPISSVNIEQDYVLMTRRICNKTNASLFDDFNDLTSKIAALSDYQQFVNDLKYAADLTDTTDYIETLLQKNYTFYACYKLSNYINSDYYSNYFSQINIDDPRLRRIKRCSFSFEILADEDLSYSKTIGTPLAISIMDVLKEKVIDNDDFKLNEFGSGTDPKEITLTPEKFYLLAGDQDNLRNILVLMGLINSECVSKGFYNNIDIEGCIQDIPFASNLILDLRKDGHNYYIYARFNGEYVEACPKALADKACTVNDFIDNLQQHFNKDWMKTCGVQNEEISQDFTLYKIGVISSFVINIILIVSVVILVMLKWKVMPRHVN